MTARVHLDTSAPAHHILAMRLTVNLESDLYSVAKALSKAEDISISEAVNRLLRRALEPRRPAIKKSRTGFPVVKGSRPLGPEDVARIDFETS